MANINEKILGRIASTTKSKLNILKSLKRNPFYIRELAVKLDLTPRAVLVHLRKFEDFGLVTSFSDGKRKFYIITAKGKRILKIAKIYKK